MDGLRLALIIAGIVVVALVYLWSARRRRLEREAGEFDSFDAWKDEAHDPLVDAEARTQPNPRLRAYAEQEAPEAEVEPDGGQAPAAPARRPPTTGASRLSDPKVLQGLEAIAQTLDSRSEPRIGAMDALEGARAAPPARASAARSPAPAQPAAAGARAGTPQRPPPVAATKQADEPDPVMVVVLNVMAPEGQRFAGPAVKAALENAGLRAGDMQLYDYRGEAQPAGSPPIFSALNVVRPGTLDPSQFDEMLTPGIALVLRLPGVERPSEAFELMHGAATRIAAELGGRLCDETRSTLTKQALNHLRETIADSVRRRRLGG